MVEAGKVAWLMEDRDVQILPVAVPGDGAFMKRNHIVLRVSAICEPNSSLQLNIQPFTASGYTCDTSFT